MLIKYRGAYSECIISAITKCLCFIPCVNLIFELSLNYNIRGREKAFILEERTVKAMSKDKISTMAKLVLEFNNILNLFLIEKV